MTPADQPVPAEQPAAEEPAAPHSSTTPGPSATARNVTNHGHLRKVPFKALSGGAAAATPVDRSMSS